VTGGKASTWSWKRPCWLASVILVLCTAPAAADTFYNSYGETGLLDMPDARMAPDGELAFTLGGVKDTQRVTLGFQLLPWLQTSFRYSHIPNPGSADLYDRSFGLKARLVREGDYVPDITIGIRDMLGTGVYGAEYLAASKRVGDFDFTLGAGWGRLAGESVFSNPFRVLSGSFKKRKAFEGEGGEVDFGQFFHGRDVGLFGGIAWQTPIDGLRLTAEYSSDKYVQETALPHGMKVRSPVNIGASYRLTDNVSLTGGWFYGSTYGFSINLHADPTAENSALRIGPETPPPAIRSDAEQQSALAQMQTRNARLQALRNGEPVHERSADEQTKLEISQALLSANPALRGLDIAGSTLLVDAARRPGGPAAQCARYARTVADIGAPVTAVALSDLAGDDGAVTICPVVHRPALQEADAARPAVAVAPPSAFDAALLLAAYAEITPATETTTAPSDRQSTLGAALAAQHLSLIALDASDNDWWIYFENRHYARDSEAAGRILRLAAAAAPASVETFHLIAVRHGIPLRELRVARSSLERAWQAHGAADELGGALRTLPPPPVNPALDVAADNLYPRLHWAVGPQLRQNFFDPDRPLQAQLLAAASGAVELTPGWSIEAAGDVNLYNNYNTARQSDSRLPHVRSDFMRYVEKSDAGISLLQTVYRSRLAGELFAEAKGGYLEDMYMGFGGQVLWRPEGSRFAFGADLYQVWKRDYDRLFGAQDYHALTGHVSLYYHSPWYGLNFNLHAGRYLAGDYGTTVEMTRRFATGVEIGAFATFTDVPFKKFGEGSFDKGIVIHIPFEWALPIFSASAYDLTLHALTRDGGQRLRGDDSLYQETRGADYNENAEHFDDIVAP
jgi:hypothetical protein